MKVVHYSSGTYGAFCVIAQRMFHF